MEANNTTSAATKTVSQVNLNCIIPSNYNPRKIFNETSLSELTESIRQQGVLQPIGIRPLADSGHYEIVFGERRYRASLIAGNETIPAIIMDITEDEAADMAITENLQRKDITPIEEASAYHKLMESGRYNIQDIAERFGKSLNYIRTRLNFTSLIPEIAELLNSDEITISAASEICRYGEDIQKAVYEQHLKEDIRYNSWRGLKASDIAKYIKNNFTADLQNYRFDKTQCASCPHNTNNLLLFGSENCGKCANKTCLEEKNISYIIEQTLQAIENNPTATLCYSRYCNNSAAIERLISMGYEITLLTAYTTEIPDEPSAPETEDFDTIEQYNMAYADYEQEMMHYRTRCDEINNMLQNGELVTCIKIEANDVCICYRKPEKTLPGQTSDNDELSPIMKLEKQDKRNEEIAREKTVDEIKRKIQDANIADVKFSPDEEKMLYFFLLQELRKEHFTAVGIDSEQTFYLTDKEKLSITANLTAKTKTIIRRDYLIARLQNAYGHNTISTLLLDFAQKHIPEELAATKKTYYDIYEKRHQRLEERISALKAQSQQNSSIDTSSSPDKHPEDTSHPDEAAA